MLNLKIESLKTGYGGNPILNDLTLSLKRGKVTSIIGPNGCGKSTLLKSIGRILKPSGGGIYLEGEDVFRMETRELAKKLAILPQSPIAPAGISVAELVAYGRFPHQSGLRKLTSRDYDIVNWAIGATGLDSIREKEVDALSGGQRQRVWIAMALCQQTDIILLDEPTTYLDMAYQLEVLQLLESLNQTYGTTIVMVLHDLNLASRVSHEMIAMRSGEIVKAGTPDEVMTVETLRAVYDIEAHIVRDAVTGAKVCQSYKLRDRKLERIGA